MDFTRLFAVGFGGNILICINFCESYNKSSGKAFGAVYSPANCCDTASRCQNM